MRSFLRRLFHDHRDDLIEELRSERDDLRERLSTAHSHILALSSTHAHRMVYKPREEPMPAPPPGLDLNKVRSQVHKPEFSLSDVRKKFQKEGTH